MTTGEEWLGIADAAERAGVHPNTIREWRKSGKLQHTRKRSAPGGFKWEVRADEIASMAAAKTQPQPPADTLPIPREEWERIVSQLGTFAEMATTLGETQRQLGRYETEVEHLRERLREAREEMDRLRSPVPEEPLSGNEPGRRSWWERLIGRSTRGE